MSYVTSLIAAATDDSLPVLAARMGEDRTTFMDFLKEAGMTDLGHRQRLCNALGRGVRLGRITKGWTGPAAESAECQVCGKRAGATIRLSTCTRCKAAKYCSVLCQKKAWPAHKSVCIRPVAENRPAYANLGAEPPSHANALPGAWTDAGRSFLPTK